MKQILIIISFFILASSGYAQENSKDTEEQLRGLAEKIPALNEVVSLSVSNSSIQELVRGIANNSGLNIDIDPSIQTNVVNNFTNVKVIDILLFLAKNYNLQISNIGEIITIYGTGNEMGINDPITKIQYEEPNQMVGFDFQNLPLINVARAITQKTGKNIILSPGIETEAINCYIQNMPFDNALDKLAFSNNLKVEKTEDNFYVLHKIKVLSMNGQDKPVQNNPAQRQNSRGQPVRNQQQLNSGQYKLDLRIIGEDRLTVFAENAPLPEVIKEVSEKMDKSYFINGELLGQKSFQLTNVTYETLLENLLLSTDFAYSRKENIYVIDVKNNEAFKESKVIQLQNRTISKILEVIPTSLLEEMELIEFPELNSLLIAGSIQKVETLEQFINKIDKIVPVIMIEVMIVDISKSFSVSTGVEAGLGDQPIETGGKIFPGVDMQLSSKTINQILQQFDGFGAKNIGVTDNFYATIKALETQGILNVRSTPRLSTLNGHEATLSIGNTEYYLEEQSNVIGTQNPQLATTQTYKSVNAELAITINPIVSGDDQITMEIDVQQSDFTARISQYAPPGSVTRKFQSLIRVKNQEVIILGGLEEKKVSDSASGVPLLSRIPVLKWFFSSRTREDSKSKLTIFIKPIIIN